MVSCFYFDVTTFIKKKKKRTKSYLVFIFVFGSLTFKSKFGNVIHAAKRQVAVVESYLVFLQLDIFSLQAGDREKMNTTV